MIAADLRVRYTVSTSQSHRALHSMMILLLTMASNYISLFFVFLSHCIILILCWRWRHCVQQLQRLLLDGAALVILRTVPCLTASIKVITLRGGNGLEIGEQ